MTVLAAIDDSAVGPRVLDAARRVADLLGVEVEAVHVRVDGRDGEVAAAAAQAARVPLHVRDGDIVSELTSAMHECDAVVLVIGGSPAGVSPAGHVALDVVQSLACTIVVVPPEAADRPLRRVLVAVEGGGESTGLKRLFDHLHDRPLPEVIALHVIERSALPPFADSPVLEADAFEQELRIRVARRLLTDPARIRFEMRVGDAAEVVRDAARDLDADLVVLAWHRDLSAGHGHLVGEVLARGSTLLALLPLDEEDSR